jgi:hypothetical protein
MTRPSWNRRDFLTASLLLLGLPGSANDFERPEQRKESLRALVHGLLGDARAARIIGDQYLRSAVDEDIGALASHLQLDQLASLADTVARQVWIGESIRRDFGRGSTTQVGGWVISLTEARLCALATLLG